MFDSQLINTLINIMEEVERFSKKSGSEKKISVMQILKKRCDKDIFEKYEDVFSELIDFICSFSKKLIRVHINEKCKLFC